ncbi:unnamed protein product [Clavelina lepadiformis]|uniref:Uncharacterized protein n=1 Tax=Clavelina lepadiformis TaxID=159417 RepID=A0ABP0H4H4_CLALP
MGGSILFVDTRLKVTVNKKDISQSANEILRFYNNDSTRKRVYFTFPVNLIVFDGEVVAETLSSLFFPSQCPMSGVLCRNFVLIADLKSR